MKGTWVYSVQTALMVLFVLRPGPDFLYFSPSVLPHTESSTLWPFHSQCVVSAMETSPTGRALPSRDACSETSTTEPPTVCPWVAMIGK